MNISDITESSKPDHVRAAERKPKLRKPSPGGESPHPYQGRMVGEVADPIADLRHTKDDPPGDLTDAYKNLETIAHLGAHVGLLKRDLDQARKYPERYHWTNVEHHISRLSEIAEYLKHQARQQIEQAKQQK